MEPQRLTPAEFCALERQLIARMAMRKKRNVKMELAQQLKLQLLEHVEEVNPDPDPDPDSTLFIAALAEAVVVVSQGLGTGPAQAVASDLQMDWDLACTSPGFVAWLRNAAASRGSSLTETGSPPS
jgi:hypothetical protein